MEGKKRTWGGMEIRSSEDVRWGDFRVTPITDEMLRDDWVGPATAWVRLKVAEFLDAELFDGS